MYFCHFDTVKYVLASLQNEENPKALVFTMYLVSTSYTNLQWLPESPWSEVRGYSLHPETTNSTSDRN